MTYFLVRYESMDSPTADIKTQFRLVEAENFSAAYNKVKDYITRLYYRGGNIEVLQTIK